MSAAGSKPSLQRMFRQTLPAMMVARTEPYDRINGTIDTRIVTDETPSRDALDGYSGAPARMAQRDDDATSESDPVGRCDHAPQKRLMLLRRALLPAPPPSLHRHVPCADPKACDHHNAPCTNTCSGGSTGAAPGASTTISATFLEAMLFRLGAFPKHQRRLRLLRDPLHAAWNLGGGQAP